MLKRTTVTVPTAHRTDFIDLTPLLEDAVIKSGVHDGIVHVMVKHTSCSLAVQEWEPNLIADFDKFLSEFASDDTETPAWLHNQIWRRPDVPKDEPRNADAHIKSLFMGNSRAIPIADGRPDLGKWQRVILVEMDGPREREVLFMTQGDGALESLRAYWRDKAVVIDAAIEPYLASEFEGPMLETSRYLTKGGKRLRGVLAILVCEALGGDPDRALDAAVAIEILHAGSLALDDIQDGDKVRRGNLAAWVAYGIRKTTALVDVTTPHAISMLQKYGKEAVYAAIESWKTIGVGQAKDLFVGAFKGKSVYDEIAAEKTGALFGLSATLGAIAAQADKETKKAAALYGRKLGYTFQVIDDTAEQMAGKPVPGSFTEWLAGKPPQAKLRALMAEVTELALKFPSSPKRDFMAELPRLAMSEMLAEEMRNRPSPTAKSRRPRQKKPQPKEA